MCRATWRLKERTASRLLSPFVGFAVEVAARVGVGAGAG